MRFDQLSPDIQESARKALEEARRTGPERFAAANERRRHDNVPTMTNEACATLAHWPPVPFSLFAPRSGVEHFGSRASENESCVEVLQKGPTTDYLQIWEEWAAMPEVLRILTDGGLTQEEAFAALIEVGFHFSYGVAALVTDGASALVGIRFGNANHSGRLSLVAGFVMSGQRLQEATADEVAEEAPGLELDYATALAAVQATHGAITFGPHDKAPSATFIVPVKVGHPLPTVVVANHEWAKNSLVAVPFGEIFAALNGDLAPITARFAQHGLVVTSGFAPDVAGPLRERFDPIMPYRL